MRALNREGAQLIEERSWAISMLGNFGSQITPWKWKTYMQYNITLDRTDFANLNLEVI